MALATYADLQASIASWLARDDLTACIPDFIALCEADLNRRLRIRAMETAVDIAVPAVPGGDSAPVPAGFKGARRLFIQADPPADLDYVTPDLLYSRPAGAVPGRPRLFTIEGDSFVFRPVPDAAYTGKLLYWQAFPALGTAGSNWLLSHAPDLYLYGSLAQSAPFIGQDDRLSLWGGLYLNAVNSLEAEAIRDRTCGGGLAMRRTGGGTP